MSVNSSNPAAVGAPVPNPTGQPNYPMASLYVGDLHANVDETLLFNKFSAAGPVVSIRVCRDMLTRRSLGYAYVNFQQPADAERVLDTLNFEVLHGRPIRIMWSQRDPSLRKSGVGNVFIKNLAKDIDNKALHDTFSVFGNILSCKIMHNMDGKSRGFGFVHFESEDAALSAISQVNGMQLRGKTVFVGQFKSKAERRQELGDRAGKFINVFIKNFAELLNDESLRAMFERFGDIYSARVFVDENKISKGFGFVCFRNCDSAERAVAELNGTMVGDRKIYVGRAMEKSERMAEIKRKLDDLRTERAEKFRGVNLFIKNLDDCVDDDRLRQEFSSFGEITSVKVMMENGRSKGFGFVCFASPEDATKAITVMNNQTVGSKPLYVALAQRKEERRQHLQNVLWNRYNNAAGNPAAAAAAVAVRPADNSRFPAAVANAPQQMAYSAAPLGAQHNLSAISHLGGFPHNLATAMGLTRPAGVHMFAAAGMPPSMVGNAHHRQDRYVPSNFAAVAAAGHQQPAAPAGGYYHTHPHAL